MPTAPGGGSGGPIIGGGGNDSDAGIDPGLDGGLDAGLDDAGPKGACDNESDLGALESAGDSLRNIARDCGQFSCVNNIGNSVLYEDCVTRCVANSVQGLSTDCAGCYGGVERCGHDAFCRTRCQSDTCSVQCLDCLNGADCITEFEACRGLPGDACPDP